MILAPVFVDPANSLPSTTLISVPENTAPETVIKLLTVQDEDGDSPIFKILSQVTVTPMQRKNKPALYQASNIIKKMTIGNQVAR